MWIILLLFRSSADLVKKKIPNEMTNLEEKASKVIEIVSTDKYYATKLL